MKKLSFIMIILFMSIINVNAKEEIVKCYYDTATIESNMVLKARIIIYDDNSFKCSFKNTSDKYNDGSYDQVQAYDLSGNKSATPNASFAKKNKVYEAYESFGKKCPNIKLTNRSGDGNYQFAAAMKDDIQGSDQTGNPLYISNVTNEKYPNTNGDKNEDTPSSNNNDKPFECVKNIDSKQIPGVTGTTYYFKLYNDGKREFCVKTKNTPDSAVFPCVTINDDKNAVVSTTDTGTEYIYTIEKDEFGSIWSNISQDNTTFTCPNSLYGGMRQTDNIIKNIILTTNSDKTKDMIINSSVNDGENNENKSEESKTSGRKPNLHVSMNVNLKGCNILGDDLTKWLQWLLDTIRIAGLVLAVVLGMMDYISASTSKDYKKMKEFTKHVSTRILSLAILFLVPTIIDFGLRLLDIGITGENPTCGIQ